MEHDLLQSEKGIFECATLNSTECNSVCIVHSITHCCWHPTVIVFFFLILIFYSSTGQGNEISWIKSCENLVILTPIQAEICWNTGV